MKAYQMDPEGDPEQGGMSRDMKVCEKWDWKRGGC